MKDKSGENHPKDHIQILFALQFIPELKFKIRFDINFHELPPLVYSFL